MQLLNAADAKVAYGLIKNWEPLKALVQALMEEETISGDRLTQILKDNNAEYFPDPFVAGFERGEDGNVLYPGSDKPGAEKVCLVLQHLIAYGNPLVLQLQLVWQA